MELIFENDHFRLGYQSDLSTVFIIWKEFETINFNFYKLPFEKALEFQKSVQVDNFLADIRKQGEIIKDFGDWLKDFPFKEAIKFGLKRATVIIPSEVVKIEYLETIKSASEKYGFSLKICNTWEEASVWLKSFN